MAFKFSENKNKNKKTITTVSLFPEKRKKQKTISSKAEKKMKVIASCVLFVVSLISLVGTILICAQGVPPISSQFAVMNMQIDDTTDQLDVIQQMYFDPVNMRSKMTASGSLVSGFLEQIVRDDGPISPSGYLLQLTGPTSSEITSCINQTNMEEEWSNFWEFPANTTYIGMESPPKYTQKFECYMYWMGGEQYKVYIEQRQNSTGSNYNVPVWSGKVFTSVPGYHLYHMQWVNFVPGAPAVSDFNPTGSTNNCQQQQQKGNANRRVIRRLGDLFSGKN